MANIQFGKSTFNANTGSATTPAPAIEQAPAAAPAPVIAPAPVVAPAAPSIAAIAPSMLPPIAGTFFVNAPISAPAATNFIAPPPLPKNTERAAAKSFSMETQPAFAESKPVFAESMPAFAEVKPAVAEMKLTPRESKPAAYESKSAGMDIGRGEIFLPSDLTTNFSPSMRMSNIEWPPEMELMAPNQSFPSLLVAGDSGEGYRAPVPSNPFKTTSQKIEEFYGCKQIGAEVIFAVHFDRARSVLLAGDFNNWTPQSTPMTNGDRPGDFKKSIKLPPGRYKYRLVVDGQWVTDPNNRHVELNQFGELDNVVEVAATNSRASVGYNAMAA
jgi:hypothetical protein